ncbi:MAG: phosphate signaling complex protein PhoU [Pseudomonadota bacterium]
MQDHIVRAYSDELHGLDRKIAAMGGLAEYMLARSFDALQARDPELAAAVIERDREIDDLQSELEEQVVQMIARRQPMANDLRQVMAAMRIATDLERSGDLAKNIAKRASAIADQTPPMPLILGMKRMSELALGQLKDVLDSYAERDANLAVEVWRSDEQIDAMYNSVFRELLTYMMEDPRTIGMGTHLMFVAKNLERIGDHTTNIAETVHFLVLGEPLPNERPKSDTTSTTLIRHT